MLDKLVLRCTSPSGRLHYGGMYLSTAVDLRRLPVPDIVEQIDFERILQENLSEFRARCEARGIAFDALVESDPAMVLIEAWSYREMMLRQDFNDRLKSVLLAYATGSTLDHLGALMGVARLQLDPGDPVRGIPQTLEGDDDFRRRILLAPESYSVAGPQGAYVFHALSAHPKVLDASVDSPTPGVVIVACHEAEVHAWRAMETAELAASRAHALNPYLPQEARTRASNAAAVRAHEAALRGAEAFELATLVRGRLCSGSVGPAEPLAVIVVTIQRDAITETARLWMGAEQKATRRWTRVGERSWRSADREWTQFEERLGVELSEYMDLLDLPTRVADMLPRPPASPAAALIAAQVVRQ